MRQCFQDCAELIRQDARIALICAEDEQFPSFAKFAKKDPQHFFSATPNPQSITTQIENLSAQHITPFFCATTPYLLKTWSALLPLLTAKKANIKIIGYAPSMQSQKESIDTSAYILVRDSTVICPCDTRELHKALASLANMSGPGYVRLNDGTTALITKPSSPFVIGRAEVFREGKDVVVFSTGSGLGAVLNETEPNRARGLSVGVVHLHTLAPIDRNTIITQAKQTGACVIITNDVHHSLLESVVEQVFAHFAPIPVECATTPEHLLPMITKVLQRKRKSP